MNGLIKTFVRHPVAPNLAMIIMVLAGLWAGAQLTRQLLPNFAISTITVDVLWPGAAAQDVEVSLTQPIEDQLLGLDEIRNISSTSRDGQSSLIIEYPEGADMSAALDVIKNSVGLIRNLPEEAEEPQISLSSRNERVSVVVLSGPVLDQLRPVAADFERQLRARGLSRIQIAGFPNEEIAIEVEPERLSELNLSLTEIANQIKRTSVDVPAGSIGENDVARQLRSLDQQRTVEGFNDLPLLADERGVLLTLGDIAKVKREPEENSVRLFANGKPAIEMTILRAETEDAISVAENLMSWMEQAQQGLPPNMELTVYNETWRSVDQRIEIMTSNAASGLLLLVFILYIFLNGRVAFWVAVGIPVAILASLMALYAFGGTINVMTLFAMIMTLGIIVDDAIVVSEEAVSRFQAGDSPARAAEKAALKMFAPVTAASLTTIAAFAPLFTIGGPTGSILVAIPLVVICVVIASLLECFVVLPGHLHHSLKSAAATQPSRMRRKVDVAFNRFQKNIYRPTAVWCVSNRRTTLSIAFAGIIIIFGLLAGGKIGFSFFPQPDGTTITANFRFTAGSPPERLANYLREAEKGAYAAEQALGEEIIRLITSRQNETNRGEKGSHVGQIVVELIEGDLREITNAQFVREWKKAVPDVPGLEEFIIKSSRGGVPGADIDVQFSGAPPAILKQASVDLKNSLSLYTGVSGVRDDLGFGKEQLIFELSDVGKAVGLTSRTLGEQLRANFEGELIQIFQDRGDEVEVRLRLAQRERSSIRSLESLPIILPNGETAPLANLAVLKFDRGFDDLKHENGILAVRVSADVDPDLNNANDIRNTLSKEVLPGIAKKYSIDWTYRGQAQDQQESVGDIQLALPLSLMSIFIILAWVFKSYLWPLAVLSVIPFSLVGAIFGHWLLGFDVTMLSLFGIFGLCGIVINDSIILIMVYQELRQKGVAAAEAAVEAGSKRLRAVFLTSFTTIAGITPLLFETSKQAQFLKPMVISISFGLLFGTLIVLFLLPAILSGIETIRQRFNVIRSDRKTSADAGIVSVLGAALQRRLTTSDPALVQGYSNDVAKGRGDDSK